MHSGSFKSCCDCDFATCFQHTRGCAESLLVKGCIAHAVTILFDVLDAAFYLGVVFVSSECADELIDVS